MSWVSCGLALWFPKRQDMLRIHSLTQKMFLVFGTCSLLRVFHVLGLLYLNTSVSQPSISQTSWVESIVGFLLLSKDYFVEFDFIEFVL